MPIMTLEDIDILLYRLEAGENVYDEEIADAIDALRTGEYEGVDVRELLEAFSAFQEEIEAAEVDKEIPPKYESTPEPTTHFRPQVTTGGGQGITVYRCLRGSLLAILKIRIFE